MPELNIAAMLMSGELDDQLPDIVDAITKKLRLGYATSFWRIDCLGIKAREDDLLLDEAWRIEQATDTDWKNIDPISTASHFRAIMSVLLQTRAGLTEAEASEKLKSLTMLSAVESITREVRAGEGEEGRAPLATAASATT